MKAPFFIFAADVYSSTLRFIATCRAFTTRTSAQVVQPVSRTTTTASSNTEDIVAARSVKMREHLQAGEPLPALEELARRYERDYPQTDLSKVYVGLRKDKDGGGRKSRIRGVFAKVKIKRDELVMQIPQPLMFRCQLRDVDPAEGMKQCTYDFVRVMLAAKRRDDALLLLMSELEINKTTSSDHGGAVFNPQKMASFLDYVKFLPTPDENPSLSRLPEPILQDLEPFSTTFARALEHARSTAKLRADAQEHDALVSNELGRGGNKAVFSAEVLHHAHFLQTKRSQPMFSDPKRAALVPFLDLINHHWNDPNVVWAGFAETRGSPLSGIEAVRATRTILPGEELLLNYWAPKTLTDQLRVSAGLAYHPDWSNLHKYTEGNETANERLVSSWLFCHPALINNTVAPKLPPKMCQTWQQWLATHRATLATAFPMQLDVIDCLYADLCGRGAEE
ncbi:unnamed protein product [Amoebophrya sp. A120]|nr:unnamed protein product [Amoebophrya sp. A120]|eukprot:GSA120T00020871001.1